VVIAARGAPRVLAPAHVKDFYMSRGKRSREMAESHLGAFRAISAAGQCVSIAPGRTLNFLRLCCGKPAAES
jgi:hypothetical protein